MAYATWLCYVYTDTLCYSSGTCVANCSTKHCYTDGLPWTLYLGTFVDEDVYRPTAVLQQNGYGSVRTKDVAPVVAGHQVTDTNDDCAPEYASGWVIVYACAGTIPDPNPAYACP